MPQRKPDPAPLLEAIRRAGGGRAAFVGDSISDTGAILTLALKDGGTVRLDHDLAARMPEEELAQALRHKAAALLGHDLADRLWAGTGALGERSATDLGRLLRADP